MNIPLPQTHHVNGVAITPRFYSVEIITEQHWNGLSLDITDTGYRVLTGEFDLKGRERDLDTFCDRLSEIFSDLSVHGQVGFSLQGSCFGIPEVKLEIAMRFHIDHQQASGVLRELSPRHILP